MTTVNLSNSTKFSISQELLDQSLEIIWKNIRSSLPYSDGIETATGIRSYLLNPGNQQYLLKIERMVLTGLKLKVIPQEIEKFEKLRSLDLSNNELTRFPKLQLNKLATLKLDGNQFDSLESLTHLKKLEDLNLSSNLFSKLPDWNALTRLHCLKLNNNKITSYESLQDATRMPTVLDCSNNPIATTKGMEHLHRLGSVFLPPNGN